MSQRALPVLLASTRRRLMRVLERELVRADAFESTRRNEQLQQVIVRQLRPVPYKALLRDYALSNFLGVDRIIFGGSLANETFAWFCRSFHHRARLVEAQRWYNPFSWLACCDVKRFCCVVNDLLCHMDQD